ncbi:MAG: inositol monophosphatase family protein [Acidimicrobiia bacterium]
MAPLPPPPAPTSADHLLAEQVARRAGELLVELRAELAGRIDPWSLGDQGDRRSHDLIDGLLSAGAPGDAVLSEEGHDDPERLAATRVWIVDPLDGTREFREAGRTDWAVHVALAIGGAVVAGAVALPARQLVLSTATPPAVPPAAGGRPRLVVSRSRPPEAALAVADALDGELVPLGSAGAKAMAVVLGEADAYLHAGGQYEWDNAAPAAVAQAAGLHVSQLDGRPLAYNKPDPWSPELLVCRPELAGPILALTTR